MFLRRPLWGICTCRVEAICGDRWKDGDFASAVEDLQEQAGVLPGGLWRDSAVGSHGPGLEELQRVAGEAEELRKKSEPPGHWMSPALALSLLLLKPCSKASRLGSLYIGPEKCHSREDEVQNTKPLTTNLSLEGGKLKVTESEGIEDRDIEGSLQVLNALRRRGVAYAFARLISWEKHEAYVACLFKYLTKPAQQGYRKVSLRQILRADKLAFSKMSEAGEDIRADASGDLPNRRSRGSRPGPYTAPEQYQGKSGKSKGYWSSKGHGSWNNFKGKTYAKGKDKSGKGKGYGGGKPEWLPEGLRYQGASAWNSSGNKNCYGFNLGTCTDPNCQKGDHKCIIFKCGGDHPVGKCPMKPKKL